MSKPDRSQYPNGASFWVAYRMWQCHQALKRR